MKTTKKKLRAVLTKLADMGEGPDPVLAKNICGAVDAMLDNMLEDDVFGTEGQLDPRGDHRG